MFIDTTNTVIKKVMNREHCSRIPRITLNRYFCSPTSNSLGFWSWRRSRTLYLTHTTLHFRWTLASPFTLSSFWHRYATCCLACEQ